MRKVIKILLVILVLFFAGWWSSWLLIRQPVVQTFLVGKITDYLSADLQAKISITGVNIEFFKKIVLENVFIGDRNNDTLLFAEKLKADFNLFSFTQKKFKVQYIGLKNSAIRLNRKKGSEDFNYEFLTGSTDTLPEQADKKQEQETRLQFDLKEADFENVSLVYRDEKTEEQIALAFDKCNIRPDKFDFKNKEINIDKILFDKALAGYTILKGDYHGPEPDTIPFVHINQSGWKVSAGDVEIKGSKFYYTNEMYPQDTAFGMDYENLLVSEINMHIKDTRIISDTIWAKIARLSAKEQSGFVLSNLSADVRITTTQATCSNLQIITPYSKIGNYYAMKYQSLYCFKDYVPLVKMTGDFRSSEVSFKDIAFFAPDLQEWKQTVTVSGKVTGEVTKLKGEDIAIRFGRASYLEGDFSLRGLPDLEATFMDFKFSNVKSNAEDIALFADKVRLPNTLPRFGNLSFQGRFTGFINDFVANGEFFTGIGNLSSDLNMKINEKTKKTTYSGRLSADNFNLGTWLNQDKLGKISGNGKIFGSGLKLDNLSTKVVANIEKLEFNNYPYSNISIDGEFNKKLFIGQLLAMDTNVHIDFSGKIDFNHALPVFDFNSTVENARLKNLNFTADDIALNTRIKLDFKGDKIDNIDGEIRITHTSLLKKDTLGIKPDEAYRLESLVLRASGENPSKTITLSSDLLTGKIEGKFLISELPSAIRQFVKNYVPSAPMNDTTTISSQNFNFEATAGRAGSFAEFLFPSLKKLNSAYVKGRFSSDQKILTFNADIPYFIYKDVKFDNWQTMAVSQADKLYTKTVIEKVTVNDSSEIENTHITATFSNDNIEFDLKANDDFPNRVDLKGICAFSRDSTVVKVLNSSIFVNGKQWDIPPSNSFTIKPASIIANDFVLQHEDQRISLNTSFDIDSAEALKLQVLNVDLADLSNMFQVEGYAIRGKIFGSVEFINPVADNSFSSYFNIQDFSVDNDTLGKVNIRMSRLDTDKVVHIKAELVNRDESIALSGNYAYNIKDSISRKSTDRLDFSIALENYPLKIAELFLPGDISGTHGWMNGRLSLHGSLEKPVLTGKVKCMNAGSTINYLNTHYTFNNEEIVFDKDNIHLNNITLKDVAGNTANLRGYFYHSHWRHFTMDLRITTENFQLLNTTAKNNELYYGTGFGEADIRITGNFENTEMRIIAKTNRGTQLIIPIAEEREFYKPEFVSFISKSKDSSSLPAKKYHVDLSGIRLNFDLEVTPDAEMEILFQEDVGGIIRGKGNANLKMEISTMGDFSMYGIYTIEEGDYLFTWQQFLINKKFKIDKGGTITWFGDPYEAKLDMNAIYKLRASAYDFIAPYLVDEQDKESAKKRVPVDLYLELTASLLAPVIDFDIKIPEDNTAPFISLVIKRLQELDKNELNRQVAGLLVMNRFIPSTNVEDRTFGTSVAQSGLITTGSELLSNMASSLLSEIVSRNITELDVSVNYRYYENGLSPADFETRNEFQLALSKQFFNNRVIVDVGGGTDFGGGARTTQANAGNFTGDFSIQYKLTPDGRYRLKLFGKTEDDVLRERNKSKTGVGIFYRREYDKFSDLWKNYRKKKEKEAPLSQQQSQK